MKKILPIILFSTLISGCTFYQVDSMDTTKEYYAPKTDIAQVQFLEKVDRAFDEIGVVTVVTERRQSLQDVLPKLQQEAAILGGDAITDIQVGSGDDWKKVKPYKLMGNAYIRSTYKAKVIIFK